MEKVKIGTENYTQVFRLDKPGPGGAFHEYEIIERAKHGIPSFAMIYFQKGPVKEAGINGCHNEDLIAVVIDRLMCFQASTYSCRENAIALTKLEEALMWLRKRTENREIRGVEGTSEV